MRFRYGSDFRQSGDTTSILQSEPTLDAGSNPAKAGHFVTTVGKLFTPTVPSGTEGRLNQLTLGIAGTFGLFSLSSLIGG